MSYKLVIAEKPSVAQSIAKVIGADKREDGYLEGNGYIVSWCVGHLVELSSPEFYDEKYEKWRYEDLPILPSEWNYQIAEATRKQFGILKKLIEREDVTGLVEATDAGREGELIFRLVYDQAKCKKPFERLWISSMEDQAISDGFSHLKNGREYDDLYRAALCRERADWIVGMNATRLFSTLYGQTLNVGRVMTPTLAMIVQREAEIDGFKPEPIYRLSISCGGITALSDRFEKKQDAENILNVLKEQKTAQVTKIDPADKQEKAPQLYSLTALQRDANRFLGFTAQQTLDYTQSLYEKKLVTYPRTDSRFLTEDMESMIPDLAGKMAAKFGYTRKMVIHPKEVINNSKVSDNNEIKELHNVWKKYQLLEKTGIKWEQILSNLYESTAPIVVRLVNQKAKEKGVERLDYEPYKETGLRVIAVGGNSLSRGLTLEGLSVSYFDRNSQMYDTLMQMGRWFGYRNGYDKLFKIWMEPAAIGWYMNMYIMYAHNCTA